MEGPGGVAAPATAPGPARGQAPPAAPALAPGAASTSAPLPPLHAAPAPSPARPGSPGVRLARRVLIALGTVVAAVGAVEGSWPTEIAGLALATFGLAWLAMDLARARRLPRPPRLHPYRDEVSSPREQGLDARRVTWAWVGLATGLVVLGLTLSSWWSPVLHGGGGQGRAPLAALRAMSSCFGRGGGLSECAPLGWEFLTEIPLFLGLGLLGFVFVQRAWARSLALVGWVLFGFYWALVAQDLLVAEGQDYVNFLFALAGTYFFTYLAYHQWLNGVRGVENRTVRFLNVSTFWAAGSYFLIDKIQVIRTWLILTVSDQTRSMLAFFGQGESKSLVYLTDLSDPEAPTNFFYTSKFCDPNHYDPLRNQVTAVGAYCRENGLNVPARNAYMPDDFWGHLLHFQPDGNHLIIPVSVILACTALQSIMLFVGLFMGTDASRKKRLIASAAVAVVVYLLNLLRNTGIIWFYGQGLTSFWVIHDAIGKGGSLLAMIGIAFAAFAWFPEFLRELIGVLDLPHRDGPVERTLRLGKRRPAPPGPPPTPPLAPGPPGAPPSSPPGGPAAPGG